ncbi:BTB/POZ and MATH domain-containing protein 1 [Zea mays]|uniref:BTB/POZ and MATH domain-containing protein 2 n=1 Tax=Zea mays TaxID=4577 RepID=B4FKN4_MAIZE|eukprot:NP_001152367.1 speckle-type POZ protein [Zea mays]
MDHDGTNLAVNEAVRSVQLLKIDGYSATATMSELDFIKSRRNLAGHEWEVLFYPQFSRYGGCIALKLVLVSEPPRDKDKLLRASLRCRLVCPSQPHLHASIEKSVSHVFTSDSRCSSEVILIPKYELPSSGYLVNDSLTVECTVTVLRDLDATAKVLSLPVPLPPPSDLHQHFDELLQSKNGADVTFRVSGKSFAAHKAILAARSPVFMAQFFGGMKERSSAHVEIRDMDSAAFSSMLHFIYTDMVPELDGAQEPEAAAIMAQHLLVAADMYGLNRLKLICECKLSGGIDIGTAASTLALAEQHDCSLLKAKCLEFITRSPETLEAVLATDGYAHLAASCPLVLAELLMAARGRKI